MILKFDEYLKEAKLGKVKRKISISVDMESTKHAIERQERHLKDGGRYITQDEIKALMTKSISTIIDKLIFDEIDIGQAVVLKDVKTKLNVACKIEGDAPSLKLKAITVMIHDNFKTGKNQLVLEF